MFNSLHSYINNSIFISLHPKRAFESKKECEFSLDRLKYPFLILLICSLLTSKRVTDICKTIIDTGEINTYTQFQADYISEIALLNIWSYAITLMTSAVFSFLSITLILFVIGKVFGIRIGFANVASIVIDAWFPMLLSTIIVTVLIYVFPNYSFIFNSSIFGFFFEESVKESIVYRIIENIDPFYIWSLIIIYFGLVRFYKKRIVWTVGMVGAFIVPIIYSIINSIT